MCWQTMASKFTCDCLSPFCVLLGLSLALRDAVPSDHGAVSSPLASIFFFFLAVHAKETSPRTPIPSEGRQLTKVPSFIAPASRLFQAQLNLTSVPDRFGSQPVSPMTFGAVWKTPAFGWPTT